MAKLIISTWIWGTKYSTSYVDKLERGVNRHMRESYEFRVFEPETRDAALTAIPGCFARLRMFCPEWQAKKGISPGDKLVCLDLDVVVTGGLDRLWQRNDSFVILHGANSLNPCPYNGSVMMLRAGEHASVWTEFSLEKAKKIRQMEFPDDQGWLWHVMPGSAGWRCGPHQAGIYAFGKPGWPTNNELPADARLVAFPGWRDPSKFMSIPWIVSNWI